MSRIIAYKIITGYLSEYIDNEMLALINKNKELDESLASRYVEYEEMKKRGDFNQQEAYYRLEQSLAVAQKQVVTAGSMEAFRTRLGVPLEDKVMNHINNGWALFGGPTQNSQDDTVIWGQAMVRYADSK